VGKGQDKLEGGRGIYLVDNSTVKITEARK